MKTDRDLKVPSNGIPPVDLHVHSYKSDGSLSPAALVDCAMEKGLSAFALTDHDTVDGIEEALARAEELRQAGKPAPEVIPGIEFSTEYQGKDVHVLGLYIDYRAPAFVSRLQEFVNSRILRNQKMCQKLTESGLPITYEELLTAFPGAVITRAHYARLLLKKGYVTSTVEAFERYIGDRGPCFIPREKVTPILAVQLILKAGGVPVLAHPTLYHLSDARLSDLVCTLKEAGLAGLEAIYSTYTHGETVQMRSLAQTYGLLISGGSDFHGAAKPGLEMGTGYGRLFVPETVLRDIKEWMVKR